MYFALHFFLFIVELSKVCFRPFQIRRLFYSRNLDRRVDFCVILMISQLTTPQFLLEIPSVTKEITLANDVSQHLLAACLSLFCHYSVYLFIYSV